MYRHTSKGAWTFSMQDHGWQVSDCTAEGLKVIEYVFLIRFIYNKNCGNNSVLKYLYAFLWQAALLFSQMPIELVGAEIETGHLYDAVNVILTLQV